MDSPRWGSGHIGVDEASGQIVASKLTTNRTGDNKHLPDLLNMYPGEITCVSADKGYDGHQAYNTIADRGAYPAILPQKSAKVKDKKNNLSWRDKVVREIEEIGMQARKLYFGGMWIIVTETAQPRTSQSRAFL